MMGPIFGYSLASALPLTFMYLVYKGLLASENQHRWNRVAIQMIYATALILPAAVSHVTNLTRTTVFRATGTISILSPEVDFGIPQSAFAVWPSVLLAIYVTGIAISFIMTLITLRRLWSIIRHGERLTSGKYTLVITADSKIAPFSWWRYIVVNRNDYTESGDAIILHETKHLDSHHWIDLLASQIVAIFQWYNPAAWLLREEFKTVHEYQADENVLRSGTDIRQYQMLLIKKAVGARFPSLANSLNHSNLKKRITMMYKSKTSAGRRMRTLALIPAAAIAVAVSTIPAVASVISDTSEATLPSAGHKVTENQSKAKELDDIIVVAYPSNQAIHIKGNGGSSKSAIYLIDGKKATPDQLSALDPGHISRISIDKNTGEIKISLTDSKASETMPAYKGGEEEMIKFLATNLQYPEAAAKAKVEGRVTVRFTVSPTGKIESPEIVQGVTPELDAEALRVVSIMPDFTPGMVDGSPVACSYVLPIHFSLQ